MMEIDILSDGEDKTGDSETAQSVSLLQSCVPVGTTAPDDLLVYIEKNTLDGLERYSQSCTSIELGSILVGSHSCRKGIYSVVISDFIEARYTDASAASLTFTHKTWEYIHRVMEAKYDTKKIVGWQHTHPGYGVFLSQYDLFIQNNFFNLPWQTACVIDPLSGTHGFFQNKNGETSRLNGYYTYGDC